MHLRSITNNRHSGNISQAALSAIQFQGDSTNASRERYERLTPNVLYAMVARQKRIISSNDLISRVNIYENI